MTAFLRRRTFMHFNQIIKRKWSTVNWTVQKNWSIFVRLESRFTESCFRWNPLKKLWSSNDATLFSKICLQASFIGKMDDTSNCICYCDSGVPIGDEPSQSGKDCFEYTRCKMNWGQVEYHGLSEIHKVLLLPGIERGVVTSMTPWFLHHHQFQSVRCHLLLAVQSEQWCHWI